MRLQGITTEFVGLIPQSLVLRCIVFFLHHHAGYHADGNRMLACLLLTKLDSHQVFHLQSLADTIKITLRYFEIYIVFFLFLKHLC